MSDKNRSILIIGYGNPGRQDDGLGPEFAKRIVEKRINGVTAQDNYQLTVEDAYDAANFDCVIFVDASLDQDQAFTLRRVQNGNNGAVESHSMSPETVIELTRVIFHASPQAYVLAIRGYEFDRFEEKLSERAEDNLQQALKFCCGRETRCGLKAQHSLITQLQGGIVAYA